MYGKGAILSAEIMMIFPRLFDYINFEVNLMSISYEIYVVIYRKVVYNNNIFAYTGYVPVHIFFGNEVL